MEGESVGTYFKEGLYKDSDVDIYIYGLNETETSRKASRVSCSDRQVQEIYQDLVKANPFPMCVVRTKNAITCECTVSMNLAVCSQYPKRNIQVITKIYKSPAEILCYFDLDSCAGTRGPSC